MTERVRVLHMITRLITGGAQDNTLITVARHRRDRHVVHLAGHPGGEWVPRATAAADRFIPLPDLVNPISLRRDAVTLRALVSLMRHECYDVVHTHSSKAGILGRTAARLAGVPAIVHTMHGPLIHAGMPRLRRNAYIAAERVAGLYTGMMIAVSEANRRLAIELFGMRPERVCTIYSGIDFAALDRPWDVDRARADVAVPRAWKLVLFVGRLDDAKAPNLLVDAFARVAQARPATALVVVGSGDLEAGMRARIDRLGLADHVRLMGLRDDVPAFLRIADVFALSSLWEGLGRAMTEAMLCGVPVVVPAIYGIPEIVRHDETGLLYPRGDVAALADGIIRLLDCPEEARRLGTAGRQLTRRLFDADGMVRSIEDVYQQVLSARR